MVHLFFVYSGLILICNQWENWNRTNILSWCIPKTCKVYLFTAYLRFPTMYYPLPQVGMGLIAMLKYMYTRSVPVNFLVLSPILHRRPRNYQFLVVFSMSISSSVRFD